MDAVFSLADQLSVMVNGRVIATYSVAKIRSNPEVQKSYLGGSCAKDLKHQLILLIDPGVIWHGSRMQRRKAHNVARSKRDGQNNDREVYYRQGFGDAWRDFFSWRVNHRHADL